MNLTELKCASQSYDWGKVGVESTVFTLLQAAGFGQTLDSNTPYAELWMGTHPSGPSYVYDRSTEGVGKTLQQFIDLDPAASLGPSIVTQFGCQLPFLFKVLSIRKALSIQAHPDKELAKALHAKQPDVYKDANHKPEMAIALTPFEALCGFRSVLDLREILSKLPMLADLLGGDILDRFNSCAGDEPSQQEVLKDAFSQLMTSPDEKVQSCLKQLVEGCLQKDDNWQALAVTHPDLREMFLRVHEQFPGDVGCLGLFFLNHLLLCPGEAIFLEANLPHAYLRGDCIECMACSDNVVRAGLTPKPKDVATLLSMLNYVGKPAAAMRFQPQTLVSNESATVLRYAPPVLDFSVDSYLILPLKTMDIARDSSASILLIIQGDGCIVNTDTGEETTCSAGQVFYLPAAVYASVKNNSKASSFLAYRAFCSAPTRNL